MRKCSEGVHAAMAVAACVAMVAACGTSSSSTAPNAQDDGGADADADAAHPGNDAGQVFDGFAPVDGGGQGTDADASGVAVTLIDDDFESDPGPYCKGWIAGGEDVPAPVHGGAQACSYCAVANGSSILYSLPGAAQPGSYELDLYVYSVKGGGTVSATCGFIGQQATYVPMATSAVMPPATWVNVHGIAAVASGATNGMQLEVKLDGAKAGDCFRMDDVRLTRR